LGGCYWNLNRFVEAADSFDQAIHLKPGFTRAYIGLADSLVSLRQYSGAANALEQALRLDTDRADVLYELAICYRALGRGAEADAAYNKARQVNPQAVAFMDRAAAEGRL
jgi:tetratricopeptide (TPR) repeat protein